MPYLPIAPQSDDRRRKQGTAPITLTNAMVRRTPTNSAQFRRAPYFITPTPGRTLRATMTDNIRGLFAQQGCRDGHLFIPNGAVMSEMTPSLSSTNIGAIGGGEAVKMRADRSSLATLAGGDLINWDGSSYTTVSDGNAPSPAATLAIVARRWLAAFFSNDARGWSKAGDFSTWDPNGQMVDQDLPDVIVNDEEIGGALWGFNAESTQIWNPTGGAEASAFSLVDGVNIKIGIAGRNLFAKTGAGGMIMGHNRVVHGTSGYDLTPVPNAALEQALKALSISELAAGNAWSYRDGAKECAGFNFGALDRAYVFDTDVGLWHERKRYNMSAYDVDFSATAFGMNFVASSESMKLWTLDDDVFTDDGDPIVRDLTVHIPSQGAVPVDKLVFDMKTRAVPVGLVPQMQVRASNDNGESWGDWRTLDLPTPSNKFLVQDYAFGLADPLDGMIIHIRISAAFGFLFYGLWVNPTAAELNGIAA